ncbi:MAG: aspartate/glutamate racemase family protein, partial [Steroidobacteraceae bacterium]
MPQHIGIVGCSAEGAALCYKTICVDGAQFLGTHAHPEVSMHTLPLAEYLKCAGRGDWPGVAELMLASARKLANVGADFLICPANTMHEALPHVVPLSPLPWLHIADAVAEEAVARGFKRLGILGTRWLLESSVYTERFAARGLEGVHPNAAEINELHRIIIDELNRSLFTPAAVTFHQQVIARLKDAGCEAVVLACTEIPL